MHMRSMGGQLIISYRKPRVSNTICAPTCPASSKLMSGSTPPFLAGSSAGTTRRCRREDRNRRRAGSLDGWLAGPCWEKGT